MGLRRVVDMLSLVRVQAFDRSTAAGRSRERYRRAGLTTLAALEPRSLAYSQCWLLFL